MPHSLLLLPYWQMAALWREAIHREGATAPWSQITSGICKDMPAFLSNGWSASGSASVRQNQRGIDHFMINQPRPVWCLHAMENPGSAGETGPFTSSASPWLGGFTFSGWMRNNHCMTHAVTGMLFGSLSYFLLSRGQWLLFRQWVLENLPISSHSIPLIRIRWRWSLLMCEFSGGNPLQMGIRLREYVLRMAGSDGSKPCDCGPLTIPEGPLGSTRPANSPKQSMKII